MRMLETRVTWSLSALLLIAAGACATTGGPHSSEPTRRSATLEEWQRLRDSMSAQSLADAEGPRVSVRAEFSSVADSRRIEAYFNLKDDAYVMVGHLDADGVVTVLFPSSPDDDGFVRGGKSYRTPEMFAGFEPNYARQRAYNHNYFNFWNARLDSYDGGSGFVFVVASWRPMRFDRISDTDRWTSFELLDQELNRDPRPAIEELADLIAGDNREAYTVEYAKYYRSLYNRSGYASLNSSYCSNYGSFSGYFYSPWHAWSYGAFASPFAAYASPFSYGCGRGVGFYALYGAQQPIFTPQRPIRRPSAPGPMTPPTKPVHPDSMKLGGAPGGGGLTPALRPGIRSANLVDGPHDVKPADEYRRRGLVVTGEDSPEAGTPRAPRSAPITRGDRPSIVDMVGGRRDEPSTPRVRGEYERPRNPREMVGEQSRPRGGNDDSFTPPRRAPDPEVSRPAVERPRESQSGSDRSAPRHAPAAESPRPVSPPPASSPRPSAPPPRAEPSTPKTDPIRPTSQP